MHTKLAPCLNLRILRFRGIGTYRRYIGCDQPRRSLATCHRPKSPPVTASGAFNAHITVVDLFLSCNSRRSYKRSPGTSF
jgi:hypothetical protein